ncbi:MAG: hypothetical protein JYX80_05155 [Candidatus Scalindua sediminis]|nr:hypothetical protein [Candidatus Scalindua sediminis]
MKCIFCKNPSSESKSIEHIIPESLGNKSHSLPPGIVCDSCNNYFARKVERRVLESGYFQSLRFTQGIPSKKKKIPPQKAFISPNIEVELIKEKDGSNTVRVPTEVWNQVAQMKGCQIIFPTSGTRPEKREMSRFLAKIAVEAFAQRFVDKPHLINDMLNDEQLEPIRQWARYGNSPECWSFHERRIYDRNKRHNSDDVKNYQVVHEYDFLFTPQNELYFCVAFFGEEFTINIGGASIDGYKQWLSDNKEISPLYIDKRSNQSFNPTANSSLHSL